MKKTWINSPDEPEGLGEAFGFRTDAEGKVALPHMPDNKGDLVSRKRVSDEQQERRRILEELMPDETIFL